MGTKPKRPLVVVTKARVLHLLLVFVIAPASAVVAGVLAKTVLPHYPAGVIAGAMLAGATWAIGVGLHYLHHNAWFEQHVEPYIDVTDGVAKPANELELDAHERRWLRGEAKPPPG